MDNPDDIEIGRIVSQILPLNEKDPGHAIAQVEEQINLDCDEAQSSNIYLAMTTNTNVNQEIRTNYEEEDDNGFGIFNEDFPNWNFDATDLIQDNHNPNEKQQSSEQISRHTEIIPSNSPDPSCFNKSYATNELLHTSYDIPSNGVYVETRKTQMITYTSMDVLLLTNPLQQLESESVINFQSELKMHFRDPRTLQRLHEFLLADFKSHLLAFGNMNGGNGLLQAIPNCCDDFLELFRIAFINRDNILYLDPMMEVESGVVHIGPLDASKNETSAVIFDPSDYTILEPILKTVSEELAHTTIPKQINKNIITLSIGKKCYNALFDDKKQNQAKDDEEVDKICMIARFLSWIFSNPKEVTTEKFAEYAEGLVKKMEHGLSASDYSYFKRNILQKFKSKLKSEKSFSRNI